MTKAERDSKLETLRAAMAAVEGEATDEEIAEARAHIAAQKAAPAAPSPADAAREAAIAALTAPAPAPARRLSYAEEIQVAVAAGLASVAKRGAA